MKDKLSKLGTGTLRMLAVSERRLRIGDVIAQTKGSLQSPSHVIAVWRPLQAPLSPEQVLAEARQLAGFEVFAPGEMKPEPEDILLILQADRAYPDSPAAILRLK